MDIPPDLYEWIKGVNLYHVITSYQLLILVFSLQFLALIVNF